MGKHDAILKAINCMNNSSPLDLEGFKKNGDLSLQNQDSSGWPVVCFVVAQGFRMIFSDFKEVLLCMP